MEIFDFDGIFTFCKFEMFKNCFRSGDTTVDGYVLAEEPNFLPSARNLIDDSENAKLASGKHFASTAEKNQVNGNAIIFRDSASVWKCISKSKY